MDYLEKVKGWAKRRKEIVRLKDKKNKTFQEIADIMGISRQRIQQLYDSEVSK